MAANNQDPKQDPKRPLNPILRFTAVGFQMGATIFLGNALGKWLDETYKETFWESLITLLAVLISMFSVIFQVLKLSKEQDKND